MGTREDFLGAYELVRDGRVRVHVDRVYPLAEAPAARTWSKISCQRRLPSTCCRIDGP